MLDIWKGNLYVMPNNKEDEKNYGSKKKQKWKLMLKLIKMMHNFNNE